MLHRRGDRDSDYRAGAQQVSVGTDIVDAGQAEGGLLRQHPQPTRAYWLQRGRERRRNGTVNSKQTVYLC
jgi:hypothetical protein